MWDLAVRLLQLALFEFFLALDAIARPGQSFQALGADAIRGFGRPGAVLFDGHDITRQPPHRRASAGIGRTFQGIQT